MGQMRISTIFRLENLKRRDQLEDLGVDEKIIRMDLRKIWWEDLAWMHLAQDMDK
jgi:hypothetical protein